MILTLRNSRIKIINNVVQKSILGDSLILSSADSVTKKEHNALQNPTEFLNSLSSYSVPYHNITLKKLFVVMLLRYISKTERHCIGTKYMVHNMTPRILSPTEAARTDKGKKFLLPESLASLDETTP